MDRVIPVIHNKTGNLYFAIADVLNCTNAQDDQKMVLYVNTDGMMFVREKEEFWQKFRYVDSTQIN